MLEGKHTKNYLHGQTPGEQGSVHVEFQVDEVLQLKGNFPHPECSRRPKASIPHLLCLKKLLRWFENKSTEMKYKLLLTLLTLLTSNFCEKKQNEMTLGLHTVEWLEEKNSPNWP